MKKIFLYISVLAAAVACNTAVIDNDPSQSGVDPVTGIKMITEIISGQRGSATKATISNDDAPAFAWTMGDNIAVHVSNGKYVFTSGDGGASTNTATANFTVVYPEGTSRDAFAVYPSTIVSETAGNYGQSGDTLDVTLPSSYALAQVSGTTTPSPMIATNSPGAGLVFYQLCGLLRLTVNSIPPSTKRLEIDFNGKKVCGNFSIASPVTPGTSVIETAADTVHDVIKIFKEGPTVEVTLNNDKWLDDLVLNIPLPTGDYTSITVTAFNALSGGDAVLTMTRPFGYTASNEYGTKQTFSFPVISISSSTRVLFSPGNLVKTNTETVASGNASYEFESVPFNTNGGSLGYGQGTPTATSARGYFTWYEATSLGSLTIGGISGWRALSEGEWNYVMAGNGIGRTMKYGIGRSFVVKGTVKGKEDKWGLLIPPDCATASDVAGMNPATAAAYQPINTGVDIDAYLDKGFIFLPAEGYYASSWARTATEGHYWSTSSVNNDYGNRWCTDANSAPNYVTNSIGMLKKGYYTSIRLVRVVN